VRYKHTIRIAVGMDGNRRSFDTKYHMK